MHEAGHDDGCTIMHPSDKDEKECKADLVSYLKLSVVTSVFFFNILNPKAESRVYGRCFV